MLVFYVPFNDLDLIAGAENFSTEMTKRIVVHGKSYSGATPQSVLSTLSDDDILYILAHGRYRSGSEICGLVGRLLFGTRVDSMTATELAKALVADGVPTKTRDVRLLVCWGGYTGGTETVSGHKLNRNEGQAPFAGQLCSALKDKGFYRVMVTGYRGAVSYSGLDKKTGKKSVNTVSSLMSNTPQKVSFQDALGGELTLNKFGGTAGTLDSGSRTVWY